MKRLWLVVTLLLALSVGLVIWLVNRPKSEPTTIVQTQTATPTPTKPVKATLSLVAKGLASPTSIVARPKDERLFVVERDGKVKIVTGSQISPETLIDLSSKVMSDNEMGLLGMVFHPKAADNRVFFNYIDKKRNTIISSFKMSSSSLIDPASEKVLVKLAQPYVNHNGGDLHFGPDGYLYIALGDGGSAGDPANRAQQLDNLFGKILRIDVDQGDPYAIPADNPFVSTAGAKGEIWFYGLRNPWRFSFDQETNDIFIADVGQGDIEEIDLARSGSKGQNFGWRCYEGNHDYNLKSCLAKDKYTFPIAEYDHSQNRCSVTGGYVYRGQLLPDLEGKYIYADFCGGQIYTATAVNESWQADLLLETDYQVSTFGQANNGELYLTDFATGNLYSLVAS